MAYTRLRWVESETPLSAQNMNNIEDGIEELQSRKVDKESGKALSDNNYTTAEKTKLAGIETGAEVNVQPDWDQTNTSADDFIKNKPGNASSSAAGFMSAADKSKLDGIQAGAQVNPGNASSSAAGLMSAADKVKLNGIATGAEVNQNAFSVVNIESGSATAIAATSKQDTVSIIAGNNVTMNASGKRVTINAKDTTYTPATTSANGLMSSSDKSKLNGIASGAEVNQNAFSNVKVGSTTISADGKTDTFELVAGSNVTLTPDATNDKVTIAAKVKVLTITQNLSTALGPGVTKTIKVTSPGLVDKTIIGCRDATFYASGSEAEGVQYQVRGEVTSTTTSSVAKGLELRVFNNTSESYALSSVNAHITYMD